MLRSRPFPISGMIIEVGGANTHDISMDLLELRVRKDGVRAGARIPDRLIPLVDAPDPARSVKSRAFRFTFKRDPYSRAMEEHHINGHEYDMMRVDERVPFGQTEIWSFVNDNWFAHPVHLHGTHFRVLSRQEGAAR